MDRSVFSEPKVVGFIWIINAKIRNSYFLIYDFRKLFNVLILNKMLIEVV